jgi:hypothetical protein
MLPSSTSQPAALPVKKTSANTAVKQCRIRDTLIWFDWSVIFVLVLITLAVSPWDLLVTMIICGLVTAVYWVTLRLVLIRVFPALYMVCTCSACSAGVPAGVERCPHCKAWFAEPTAEARKHGP